MPASLIVLVWRPVATVLTVYGIETIFSRTVCIIMTYKLQQYLPFTVLKQEILEQRMVHEQVATVLTVYGIETLALEPNK